MTYTVAVCTVKNCWWWTEELDALISQIYFWNKTLHVSDSSSVHHQQFFTVDIAMVYVIQVTVTACDQDQDGTAFPSWSWSQAVWHIALLCVQWKTADDGQRNCPKHVEYYSKIKFEKLVHLVGCVTRILAVSLHMMKLFTLPTQCRYVVLYMSWDSSVSIVTRLRHRRAGVRMLERARHPSLLRNVQTGFETHTT